jgi:hypothetical protein
MKPQQGSENHPTSPHSPNHDPAAASRRRPIAIVGGGMAGVSLAWLLDGVRDVILLEARDTVGGNVQSVEVDLEGHRFMVDLGAQYFHPGPYPVYTALLRELDLYDPDSSDGSAHSFPASITLTAGIGDMPRFVSPVLPQRRWPFFAPWNAAGLGAFGVGFIAARVRDHLDHPWDVTLDEWLPGLGLARKQWEGMLLPWAASLFSGRIDQARRLAARAAMIFAARALPANPFDPLHYYVLKPGMIAAMTTMLAQCSTVQVLPAREWSGLPGPRKAVSRSTATAGRRSTSATSCSPRPGRPPPACSAAWTAPPLESSRWVRSNSTRRGWRFTPIRHSRQPIQSIDRSSTVTCRGTSAKLRCGSRR